MPKIDRLPDAELRVMQAVWESTPPVSRAEIEAVISKTQPLASTTILTLLSRLAEKGFIDIQKAPKGNLYTPLIAQHDYLAAQGNSFFKKLCGGDMRLFASALSDSGLSPEEIEELRTLLKKGEL